jgi:hypothetical protein
MRWWMSQGESIGETVRKLLRHHERGIICFGEVYGQVLYRAGRAREVVAALPADVVERVKDYLKQEPQSEEDWRQAEDRQIEHACRFFKGRLYEGDKNDESYRSSCQARTEEIRRQTALRRSEVETLRAYFQSLGG